MDNPITFRCSPKLRAIIGGAALATGRSQSEFIRDALEREAARSMADVMAGLGDVAPHLANLEDFEKMLAAIQAARG